MTLYYYYNGENKLSASSIVPGYTFVPAAVYSVDPTNVSMKGHMPR